MMKEPVEGHLADIVKLTIVPESSKPDKPYTAVKVPHQVVDFNSTILPLIDVK